MYPNFLVQNHIEQCGFPWAIIFQQSNFACIVYLKISMLKNDLAPKTFIKIFCLDEHFRMYFFSFIHSKFDYSLLIEFIFHFKLKEHP